MSAYLIADVSVTKPAQYEDYKRLSTLAMRAYDAKIRCAAANPRCSRGVNPAARSSWNSSMGAAQAFYDSWQYRRAAMPRRRGRHEYVYRSGNVKS